MKIVPNINNNKDIYFKNNFKKITLKTAEKLYNANFTPSGKNYGAEFYPTFALDKLSGKPVEIFVKLKRIEPDCENYELYQDINGIGLRYIGIRFFNVDSENKQFCKGYMSAYSKNLAGLGLILQMLTYERKKMLGFDNIKILSTNSALNFHKGCGFEEIITDNKFEGYMQLSPEAQEDWDKMVLRHPIFSEKNFPKILV